MQKFKRFVVKRRLYIIWISITIAAALFTYPSFADAFSNIQQTQEISGYTNALQGMGEEELSEEKQRIIEYNEKIYKQQLEEVFSYRGEEATDEEYESILFMTPKNSMCYLDIPDIDLYIAVAHGTKEKDLKTQAGHMYGTSLPYGGENTNAVIAGHTGLTNAVIFSELEDLEEDDVFYIHVLDEVHAYRIGEIYVVLPEEEIPYLQIRQGKDLVTLYTCTPYGVNSHRLILVGERDKSLEKSGMDANGTNTTTSKNKIAKIKTIILGSIPIAVFLIGWVLVKKAQKKRSQQLKNQNAL